MNVDSPKAYTISDVDSMPAEMTTPLHLSPLRLVVWSKNSNAPFSQSLRAHLRSLYILHPIWLCPILTTTEGQRF